MSKIVKAVVAIGAAVVGFFVGGPVGAAIGFAAALGVMALRPKTNAKNTATADRLNKTLAAEDFRKIVFGETAFASDIRYYESYGAANYDEVVACATHKVESFGKFYLDGVEETFSGTASTGVYTGNLAKSNVTAGVTATGTALGAGSLWTSAASFTGCAYYTLKWLYDQTKHPNGIPQRYCQVGKGAKVYDPRKDTTNGGTGSHRYNDQTTWEYSPTDSNGIPIGRNNALQMLWYLLGWTITNPATSEKVLVAGRGVDPADIDWPSWITAANACETEHYYTDCILSTGDSHDTNEGIIAAGAQGVLLDTGGLWSYWVSSDDTASIAVALTEDDIVSGVKWTPRDSIQNQWNRVGGSFIDPSTTSLYQAAPYPMISDSTYLSEDGGTVKKAVLDFQNVQDAALAQKNARTFLNRSRWTGRFEAEFNYRILKANNWNIVTLTFARLGFSAKLFRIISMSLNPNGSVACVLQEEAAAIYTAGSTSSYTAPAAGSAYNSLQQIALSGLAASALDVGGSSTQHFDGITISWTTVGPNVKRIETQYRKTGDTIWQDGGMASQAGTPVDSINIWPVVSLTGYDVRARTISIDDIPGAWASTTVTSGNYANYGAAGALADGTVIFDSSTPGSFSFTVPSNALAHVDIYVFPGGGGGGITHGGGGGEYRKYAGYAVTAGTTTIAGSIGAGGDPYYIGEFDPGSYTFVGATSASNGGDSTITTPAITAKGGGNGGSAAGAAGTGGSGGTANTAGEAGDSGGTGNGGANLGAGTYTGGARQTGGAGSIGNSPGGGGFAEGPGANGRVVIITRT